LGDQRVLHRLGHLFAGLAVDEARFAENLARNAVAERELLAVAGDLGDFHPAAIHQVDSGARVAGQVNDLAAADLAQLDSFGQLGQDIRREVLEQRYLAQVPKDATLVLHADNVSPHAKRNKFVWSITKAFFGWQV